MTRVNLFSVYNIQYQHIISQFGKYLLNKTLEDFAQQNSGDFGDFFFPFVSSHIRYGSSKARVHIRAAPLGLCHSHGNVNFQEHL